MTPLGTTADGWPRVRIDWGPVAAPGRPVGGSQDELGCAEPDVGVHAASGCDGGGSRAAVSGDGVPDVYDRAGAIARARDGSQQHAGALPLP
jgi:hypothetical protein